MKYWCFILWLLLTFIASISILGWILFIPANTTNPDNKEFVPSTWMSIGKMLLKVLNKQDIINNDMSQKYCNTNDQIYNSSYY